MAPRTFAARLEKLQAALASQLNKPLASRFLEFCPDHTEADYDRLREEELDQMVADGEIGPNQRGRVLFMRWMTAEENSDRVRAGVDGPVPDLAQGSGEPREDLAPKANAAPVPAPGTTVADEASARFNGPLDLPDLGII